MILITGCSPQKSEIKTVTLRDNHGINILDNGDFYPIYFSETIETSDIFIDNIEGELENVNSILLTTFYNTRENTTKEINEFTIRRIPSLHIKYPDNEPDTVNIIYSNSEREIITTSEVNSDGFIFSDLEHFNKNDLYTFQISFLKFEDDRVIVLSITQFSLRLK